MPDAARMQGQCTTRELALATFPGLPSVWTNCFGRGKQTQLSLADTIRQAQSVCITFAICKLKKDSAQSILLCNGNVNRLLSLTKSLALNIHSYR